MKQKKLMLLGGSHYLMPAIESAPMLIDCGKCEWYNPHASL